MSEFPLGYERIAPTTWVYLSSILMLGLFFKFNRVWSIRNFDLILLILLAPGLLLVFHSGITNPTEPEATVAKNDSPTNEKPPPDSALDGKTGAADPNEDAAADSSKSEENSEAASPPANGPQLTKKQEQARLGYVWLLVVGGLFVIRMLVDTKLMRRPLLEPNLSTGGMAFIGCSLLIFLLANIVTSKPSAADLEGPREAARMVQREATSEDDDSLTRHGPGNPLLSFFPNLLTISSSSNVSKEHQYANAAKVMAIIANLAIVVGLVIIGSRHFGSMKTGVAVAAVFLMLPYTAIWNAHAKHVIPAALMVWAIVCYRRPAIAGVFVGLAAGVLYYPLFLIPLWVSFYWSRGKWWFLAGTGITLAIMAGSLAFVSEDFDHFVAQLRMMFGFWLPLQDNLTGVWGLGWDPVYRLPILVAFIAMSVTFALWPARKNLGTLICCSAALMAATQFWHGHNMGGGVYLAWYAPLALLAIFRPNLEDRVAISVLAESWRRRRNGQGLTKAA